MMVFGRNRGKSLGRSEPGVVDVSEIVDAVDDAVDGGLESWLYIRSQPPSISQPSRKV